jgi:DNA-binding transcriptional ArsR family regulator
MWYSRTVSRRPTSYAVDPNVAEVAALIGDAARAVILLALIDGRELPASELAFRAGASPSSASAHLAKLVDGGLLKVTAAGRQRLFRLASPEVGHALETLAAIARPARIVALNQNFAMERLRAARSCYDHLAGRLGVAVTDALLARDALARTGSAYEVTQRGKKLFGRLGIDLTEARQVRRNFARPCLDWTERRPHLAGSLGAALMQHFLSAGWVARSPRDRALRVTPKGCAELERHFRIRL